MNESAILNASSIRKTYPAGTSTLEVLKGVDLSLCPGEFVSIQGESGCGKTTLLNILAGIEQADTGTISWNGKEIDRLGRNELARKRCAFLGIVFQSYYLVPEIDALQNVLMSLRIAKGSVGPSEVERGKSMLQRVGLADRFSQMPSTLSGGERQRVAIARSLITQPKLVLADEPTGNLDERTGDSVMALLQTLCNETGASLLLVTHNAEHAARANRQLTLTKGVFDE
ncbi:ABC transporter ATP-binding protein [Pelagicoccus sp. SDUM812003]|uniref:ABC transporter ATP-binding protein n=1 Tax=Pelagicoccus sp. SDUM812003 TaxID=3041267 RepID=UPI00280DE319|nr:ABC transporter ATP-binding protein [Pelagicoccus sp. SDUM812003]MDQ8205398.1 ABC transporter ATP-binding protein [Pelagicoccus sp. SDUM812003]